MVAETIVGNEAGSWNEADNMGKFIYCCVTLVIQEFPLVTREAEGGSKNREDSLLTNY